MAGSRVLEEIKLQLRAGSAVERLWESLRLAAYPGLDHESAARKLGIWAQRYGIDVDFAKKSGAGSRTVEVLYVLFRDADAAKLGDDYRQERLAHPLKTAPHGSRSG